MAITSGLQVGHQQGWGLASVRVSRSPHMVLQGDVYLPLEAENFDISVLRRAISSYCAPGQRARWVFLCSLWWLILCINVEDVWG